MMEIKFSQGVKFGYGGFLFGVKVIEEIVVVCKILVYQDCLFLWVYFVFFIFIELLEFVVCMCEFFGGKFVGIKLCVGYIYEVLVIMKVMLKIGIYLDYIVVDGAEGGIGVVLLEFLDFVGMLFIEGLIIVCNVLVGIGLCDKVKLVVSGKVYFGVGLVCNFVIGVDWCNVVCVFMFFIGCIQVQCCYIGICFIGIII